MRSTEKIFQNGQRAVCGEEEMRELGRQLAEALEVGDALGMVGELGAGKTRLVQGILEGLASEEVASSPTFSIVHEHMGGRLPAAHFDFYRLQSEEEMLQIGWEEYLDSGMVLLVEWADRFDGRLMPEKTVWLRIERRGENRRLVSIVRPEAKR